MRTFWLLYCGLILLLVVSLEYLNAQVNLLKWVGTETAPHIYVLLVKMYKAW